MPEEKALQTAQALKRLQTAGRAIEELEIIITTSMSTTT